MASEPSSGAALAPTRLQIVSRVAASLLGGWAFVWGFVTLGVALLLTAGMPFGDARTLVYLLAFLVFLVAFLWAFAAASLARVWAVLAGGGVLMTGLAWLLSQPA
ncbi:iron uptake protein [Roseateles sp. DAIF2]|uniref:iron uptake protein n=1 Tax=Roseateles sp. DAIF2 TaxID=2714952 RepID=UPI0018A293D0|nr:iron uptake protein [Roseateles sp. DAIF2]QPF73252.1 iron uptake protein [Roseateles sp. DAIF2]